MYAYMCICICICADLHAAAVRSRLLSGSEGSSSGLLGSSSGLSPNFHPKMRTNGGLLAPAASFREPVPVRHIN